MKISPEQLATIMPPATAQAVAYAEVLNAAMLEFDIVTERRVQCFLAELEVESRSLQAMTEGLNYSAEGLANTWPPRFAAKDGAGAYIKVLVGSGAQAKQVYVPNDRAKLLARHPEAIANSVYANRMGNGSETSGDGWRFRGAGWIQLTGRDLHTKCAAHFGIPLDQIGDWLRTPEGAARSAAWFWQSKGLNELADECDTVEEFVEISVKVNGGHLGEAQRIAAWQENLEVIA